MDTEAALKALAEVETLRGQNYDEAGKSAFLVGYYAGSRDGILQSLAKFAKAGI